MRIGLLNNLRAGRSDAQVSRILSYLAKNHPDVVSIETDTAGAVPEALASLARDDVDVLVVNGGDGTLQHALTEILDHRVFDDRVPMIAPLRGGRTNMSALDFGAHRDPVRGLASVIDAVKTNSLETLSCPRRVLRVEYGARREALYGMFFGGGVIYKGIELTHSLFPQGRSQGVLGATLVITALVSRLAMGDTDGILQPNKADVMLDDEALPGGEFHLLMTSTLGRLLAGMRPFWGVGPGKVRFTSIASGAQHLSKSMPGIVRGRPREIVTPEAGYTSRNAHNVHLRIDFGFTVDGELVEPEPGRIVTITAEDTVRFLRA